jgi:hypothetical protein
MYAKTPQTLIEKYNAIQDMGSEVTTPYEVFCLFKDLRTLNIMGDQISFGEDYMHPDEARKAVAWLVTQLGGTVKWT